MATVSDPSDKQRPSADGDGSVSSSLGGLRFNQTGREDAAREVLKPQRDPAAQRRTAGIIAVLVLGLLVIGALSFARSGLTWSDIMRTDDHGSFGTQQQNQNPDQADSGGPAPGAK